MRPASLIVVGVSAALLVTGSACDLSHNLERMTHQSKYKTFGASTFFADGRAMRTPPEGSVPHAAPPGDFGDPNPVIIGDPLLTEGMVGTTYAATVPVPMSMNLLERGRNRFEIFCATCHGIAGNGDSEVARRMSLRKPPSLHDPIIRAFPPGRIFSVISKGYGLMPSYAFALPVPDRWAVVAYVKALQLSQHATLADLPADVQQEAEGALQ